MSSDTHLTKTVSRQGDMSASFSVGLTAGSFFFGAAVDRVGRKLAFNLTVRIAFPMRPPLLACSYCMRTDGHLGIFWVPVGLCAFLASCLLVLVCHRLRSGGQHLNRRRYLVRIPSRGTSFRFKTILRLILAKGTWLAHGRTLDLSASRRHLDVYHCVAAHSAELVS